MIDQKLYSARYQLEPGLVVKERNLHIEDDPWEGKIAVTTYAGNGAVNLIIDGASLKMSVRAAEQIAELLAKAVFDATWEDLSDES